jgi:hypothetical protein
MLAGLFILVFEMNRVRLLITSNNPEKFKFNIKLHNASKWIVLILYFIKTSLLAINNYFFYAGNSLDMDAILRINRNVELYLKIITEVYIYPLFLYCLIFFIKRYKESRDSDAPLPLSKILLIVWVYFLFILSSYCTVYSTGLRYL